MGRSLGRGSLAAVVTGSFVAAALSAVPRRAQLAAAIALMLGIVAAWFLAERPDRRGRADEQEVRDAPRRDR